MTSIEHAYGSAGNDVLLGNAANNQFVGLGGNDQMDGRDGNDFLDGSGGNDSLIGASGSDTLWGGDGNDTLNGGFSNDVLWGGYGDDVMTGGNGADHFLFYSLNEFDSYDVITDFQSGLDKIDLSALDAQPDVAGRQPFTFDSTPDGSVEEFFDMLDDWNTSLSDGSPNISGDPGEVEFRHDGGYTYIYVSTADRSTDAEIRLDGTFWLTESSFIL